jgi:hypothetical protein
VLSLGTSELVISWMRVAERQNVEALRQQALERRTSATQFNNELGEALRSGKKVADHIQPGVSEAMNELRTNFGDLVPENATSIADLPSKFSLGSAVKNAVTALQGEATAADVKSIITEKATPVLQKKAVENALGQSLKKCGLDSNPALLIDVFLRQIPELLHAVQGCQNRAALDGVIANHAASIECPGFTILPEGESMGLPSGDTLSNKALSVKNPPSSISSRQWFAISLYLSAYSVSIARIVCAVESIIITGERAFAEKLSLLNFGGVAILPIKHP